MRYVGFLRAINVGGHRVVKMDRLRALFEDLGYSDVATFIASGNVTFTAAASDAPALETRIERKLAKELGFEVATFVRTAEEVAAIGRYDPFKLASDAANVTVMIAFLRSTPSRADRDRVMRLRTATDDFHIRGRELYWLLRTRLTDSPVSGAALERALGPATMRSATTLRKLAARCA